MQDDSPSTFKNKILGALSDESLKRLTPSLEWFDLPLGSTLFRAEEKISYVYFPESSMISVVVYDEAGQSIEAAVIGSEGVAGIDALMGAETTPNEHMTQLPNGAMRIKTSDIRREFEDSPELRALILAFTRRLIVQMSRTALCNRLHVAEQRLAKWLLMCRDRAEFDRMPLTHEFLGIMLGASRTTVTLTAISLQKAGLIEYKRGSVTITDRPGLEAAACDCYEIIRTAYNK